MTNRKLKLAAMSVALTACVAAQPMAAHAVEGPDAPADDNAAPQAEPAPADAAPVEGETAEGEVEGEEEKQEEFVPPVNEEARSEEQAPAFGPGTKTDDITIDYKPAEKPEEPGESGEDGETDGSEGSGETDETESPDGTYVKGDVIDNSKKDEATGEDGKIGEATKEETPDSSSSTTVVDPDAEVKKGDPVVGKDEDGNTTITTPTETTGTETTTTTGTGKADSSTTITDTKKGEEINLDDELGKDVRPDWGTGKDAKLGDYTVDKVETAEDGNSKELTLKKTSPTEEKEMAAEDIAKLLDVPEDGLEKKTDNEGSTTYLLKKTETSVDENGNTVTRTTYYEITGNSVKTRTETTLVLKVEKSTVEGSQDVTEKPVLPSIIVTNKNDCNDSFTIKPSDLDYMLKHLYSEDGNVYTYVESGDTSKRTYTITKTDEKSRDYTNAEIAKLLGDGYTADDNGVYYKGNKLSITEMDAVHMVLSYTVEVNEERYNKDQPENDHAQADAAEAAKLAAIKNALEEAAKSANINIEDSSFKEELAKITVAKDGTFVYTDGNDHTFTFKYTVDATVTAPEQSNSKDGIPGKNPDDIKDVKDNTVTGTAYVTGGKEEWTESGSFDGTYTAPGSGTLPTIDGTLKSKTTVDGVTTKVYEKVTVSADGKTTTTITYTIVESAADLTPEQKEALAWQELLKQNPEYKNKDELLKAGFTITGMNFDDIKQVNWTITEEVKSTDVSSKELNDKLVIPGGKNWSINEKGDTITVDGTTYRNVTKNADGSYTCTDPSDEKITYTFTRKAGAPLTETEIKNALADKYGVLASSIELKDGAAIFQKDGSTVTVDYSTLSETITVRKDVHESASITTTVKTEEDLQKAYDELWKQIEAVRGKLQPGESLWIGDLEVTDKTEKKDIIQYITKAISPEDMTKEELIKALREQERIAKETDYVANAGSKYEETKKNYYDGTKNGTKYFYTDKNGSKTEVSWHSSRWGGYYYYTDAHGQEIRVDSKDVHSEEQNNNIGHLDLASGSKLDLLPDEEGNVTSTDCVLVSKDLKLEWNYDAEDLVNGKNNHRVGLDSKISWDDEGGEGDGHYEYDRDNRNNNNPDKSAYYKLTGTVAYDPIKENGSIKLYQGGYDGRHWVSAEDQAINAYLKATGSSKTAASLTKKERDAIVGTYVVQIGTTGTNTSGQSGYQVYLKTSELTAYGYMTRDANTCINNTYYQQTGTWEYIGGYDLMISELTQVREGKVVGQTESNIKTLFAALSIRSSQDYANRLLELNKQTTSTPTAKSTEHVGSSTSGGFSGTYTQNQSRDLFKEGKVKGTGTGSYKSFTEILRSFFNGEGHTDYDEGGFKYSHRTEDNVTTSAVSKTTETTTDAHVDYNFTTIETRTVIVNGEETVIVPPVTPPETPVEDETPDEVVVTPETPELPSVQDATPDAPVLPSDVILPAVQDALPQTGVNWMAALGMAFSGMLLTITGAFTSLKYKEKH